MTINGYKVSETEKTRGPIKVGPGRGPDRGARATRSRASTRCATSQFVMKDGLVFKRDGVVTPEKFFNPGPVNGWRIR